MNPSRKIVSVLLAVAIAALALGLAHSAHAASAPPRRRGVPA